MTVWQAAVDAALEDYTNLTAKLNESLLEDVLTGKQLDQTEIGNLVQYGDDIVNSVITGINQAKERDLNLLDVLFDDISDPNQAEALDIGWALDNAYYTGVMGQAQAIGAELRAQMVEALKDNKLDENERQAIMATEERLNAIMQEINAYNDEVALNEQLYQAQHVSVDSATDYLKNLVALDKEANENIEKNRAAAWASYKTKYDTLYENDGELTLADGTVVKARDIDINKYLDAMMAQYDAEQAQIHGQYAGLADVMFQTLFHDSKFGDAYNWLAGQVDAGNVTDTGSGYGFAGAAYDDLTGMTDEELKQLRFGAESMTDSAHEFSGILQEFGDTPYAKRLIDILSSASDLMNLLDNEEARRRAQREAGVVTDEYGRPAAERIDELTDVDALRKILSETNLSVANGGFDLFSKEAEQYHQAIKRLEGLGEDVSSYVNNSTDDWYSDYLEAHKNDSREAMEEYLANRKETEEARLDKLTSNLTDTENEIAEREARIAEGSAYQNWWYSFSNGPARDFAALNGGAWQNGGGLYGKKGQLEGDIEATQAGIEAIQGQIDALDNPTITVDADVNEESLQDDLDALDWHLKPPEKGGSAAAQLADQGVTVTQVYGDTTMLDASIAAEDGQTLMQYVNGDTDDLHAAIYEEDGQTLIAYVDGNTDAILQELNNLQGRTVHVNIVGSRMFGFAEGGRATEPSIFGEGDTAEWAIPEAHTERTAQLLNKAREASGFTWGDILGRFGGLNADPNHVNVNLTYAPTINAGSAEGVSDALDNDKGRVARIVREAVKKAMNEARMHDELEVYA